MKHLGITYRERKNTAGTISYRVELPPKYSETGKRQLVQFKTKGDAKTFIESKVVERENLGTAANLLTAGEREDAAKALAILRRFNATLLDAAEFLAKHSRPPGGDITSRELAEKLLDAKTRKKKLRKRSVQDLRNRLAAFNLRFGDRLMKDVRAEDIESYIYRDSTLSDQTKLNDYRVLKNFFNYAYAQEHIAANPMLKVTRPHPESAAPKILTVKECENLLNAALVNGNLAILPYITLGMFCGIRSSELDQLDWSAVDLDAKTVTVSAQIAKKRRIRIVDIPDNAVAWLRCTATQTGPIRPIGLDKRFDKLVALAGLKEWPINAMRHSAGSYHYALHGDAAKTCAMLGQKNDDVLFTHYRSLVKKADAVKFFALLPPPPAENVIRLAS